MAADRLKLEVVLNAVDRLTRPLRATRDESRQLATAIKATQARLRELGDTEERLGKLAAAGRLPFSNGTMAAMMRDAQQESDRLNTSLREQQARLEALNRAAQRRASIAATSARIAGTRDSLARNGAGMAVAGGAMVAATGAPLAAFAQAEDAATGLKVAMMNARGEVPQTFAQINQLATRLGDRLPGTTADFQNMMTMLIRQGMSAQAILGGLGQATAYLAVQLKMPTEAAAEFAAKMQDATRTSERDMMGLMDVIQKGFYLGVDQNNMLQAFTKMSPALDILKKKGLEGARALAPLVVLADQAGMAGESAGNAYRKVFQLAMDAKKVAAAGKAGGIGLDFTNGKGEFGGIEKMMTELQKLRGLSTQKRLSVIKTIFGDDAETLQVVSLMIDKGVAGYTEVQGRMAAQADLQKRVNEQLGTLKNLWDAASGTFVNALASFGAALAPDIKQLVNLIGDLAGKLSAWSAAHPALSKWLLRIVAGAGALLVVLGGLSMAAAAVLTPFTMISKGLAAFSSTARIVVTGFTLIRTAVSATTAFMMANPIVLVITAIAVAALLLYRYWTPIRNFFMGVWAYIDAAFKKYPILNYLFPIIGAARLLIAHWDAVRTFFAGLWTQIKTAFSGGLTGIATLIANWSPLGLFYTAFAKVLGYFGIELPGRFTGFGQMLLQGLVNGITQGLTLVKQTIEHAGGAVVGWFKDKLGIHSPSTVFAQLGGFTMAGLDAGLQAGQHGPLATIGQIGQALTGAGSAAIGQVGRLGRGAVQAVAPIMAAGSPANAAAGGAGNTFHIYPAAGMDEQALAQLVAQKVAEASRHRQVQARARLADAD